MVMKQTIIIILIAAVIITGCVTEIPAQPTMQAPTENKTPATTPVSNTATTTTPIPTTVSYGVEADKIIDDTNNARESGAFSNGNKIKFLTYEITRLTPAAYYPDQTAYLKAITAYRDALVATNENDQQEMWKQTDIALTSMNEYYRMKADRIPGYDPEAECRIGLNPYDTKMGSYYPDQKKAEQLQLKQCG